MGGFFGPEVRFAGYDGTIVTGRASSPVYITIDDDRVEIRDATRFWGMKTNEFDSRFSKELGGKRFQTCYIGPAGENLVSYASIIHTAARAAGRGVGAVMGSKNLKAIAVKGSKMPPVADHKRFLAAADKVHALFKSLPGCILTRIRRNSGTAGEIEKMSQKGIMAVKNFREGTFPDIDKIGANLMVSDLGGILKAISDGDDYGMDIISAGNVLGFLMETYEKKYIDTQFLDGLDLTWGKVEAILAMLEKIAVREGIGDLASKGVKALSARIGRDSEKFACHVKGLEFPAHNIHDNPHMGVGYATSNRGPCHLSSYEPFPRASANYQRLIERQNYQTLIDSLGMCMMAVDNRKWYMPGYGTDDLGNLLRSITGIEWAEENLLKAGERIFNLEKLFNYREGFRRGDDRLPDRFFEEPLTIGKKRGAVLSKKQFNKILDQYYQARGWSPETTEPGQSKLEELGLLFL
ncbi:MAG: aldehyde ferredoxin oxidoreductase family protein [bacterium]